MVSDARAANGPLQHGWRPPTTKTPITPAMADYGGRSGAHGLRGIPIQACQDTSPNPSQSLSLAGWSQYRVLRVLANSFDVSEDEIP